MLTILIVIAAIWLSWKLLALGVSLAWGIGRILGKLMVPLAVICLAYVGLKYFVFPTLVILAIEVIGGIMKTT